MNPNQEKLKALFGAALALESDAQRRTFLDHACPDAELRREVESLLEASQKPNNLLTGQGLDLETTQHTQLLSDVPGAIIGRYKLREIIGQGGCGVVYVAEQEEPVRRRVALKVIKLGMDTQQVIARFEAERQALAMMDHPNIAKVLDAGTTEAGRPFFVMELVRGIKITEFCDQNNLTTQDRLDLFIKVCQAIQHAHQKGIIHRDIKPSNVLVTQHDSVPVPKVIDFGIAKATEGRLTDATVYTQLHQFIGTPAYMSPEQAEMSGLDIDTRSDIYSLGVLLYELLAGSTPFDAQELVASGIDTMRKTIREKEPLRPSTKLATLQGEELIRTAKHRSVETSRLAHLLRADLDWIVMKCLEKDRARRYETATGLAADLRRFLNDEPVVARPPSLAYQVRKAMLRHKTAFAAGAVVLSVMVAALAISCYLLVKETQAHRRAVAAELAQSRLRSEAEQARAQEFKERQRAVNAEAEAKQNLYSAQMNLAHAVWDQNDGAALGRILEETSAFPDRGFEWFYWQRQRRSGLATIFLPGHPQHNRPQGVTRIVLSPDSTSVLSYLERELAVCRVADGKLKFKFPVANGFTDVAFAPDGQRFMADGSVFNAATGAHLLTLLTNETVFRAAFSADNRRIVTVISPRVIRSWDAKDGRPLSTVTNSFPPFTLAVSPDGARVLCGTLSESKPPVVWDLEKGRSLFSLAGPKTAIGAAAFSPDGKRLATGGFDQTLRLYDSQTGELLYSLQKHTDWISVLDFSPDSHYLATGSGDQTVRVWDVSAGLERLTLKGHSAEILALRFSPDNRQIVSVASDHVIKVWKGPAALEPAEPNPPSRFRVLFPGSDKQIVLESASPAPPKTNGPGDKPPGGRVVCTGFSQEGTRLISGGDDGLACIWDVATGKPLLVLQASERAVTGVSLSRDGQLLATGASDGAVRVWDAASGLCRLKLDGYHGAVEAVQFSPDGNRIAAGSGNVTIWDATTGASLCTVNAEGASEIAFSADGQRMLVQSHRGTAMVADSNTGQTLLVLGTNEDGGWSFLAGAGLSPDASRVIATDVNGQTILWDTTSGHEILRLKGKPCGAAAFSLDGRRIVTGALDGTVSVWHAETGQQLLTLKAHVGMIQYVGFVARGRWLASFSPRDQTVRVWEAASPEQVASWQQQERGNRHPTAEP